ncbi:PfkB family carbohydrate kinase [Mangrovicoccus sp. HB161399]|uniref:PfkB family carbohydrate kinase n=1 Tax=Mangrovicoccus sp. HB161399 TaxID=2720392 RepID=UPI001553A8D0|nr:PfkB family carbohydrate kinase [Mangrovicoccus sp. HB161399]
MARIFVCGEAIMDFVPVGTAAGEAFLPLPGGSPMNTAKAAACAGAESHFLGAISRDLFGERLLADMVAHGVRTGLTPRSDLPSTLAFVDMSTGEPRYAFYDRDSAAVNMAPTADGIDPQPGDILAVGSISLIPEPGAGNILRFALGQADSQMLAFDPNVRANMITDRAAWEPRVEALFAAASIVKISSEDLDYLRPGQSREDFAAELTGKGVGLVVVTGGSEGALGLTRAGRAQVMAPKIAVADTVGAGDTFMGNLLAGILEIGCPGKAALSGLGDAALETLLTRAAWAAAINCTRTGCNPPQRQEVLDAIAAGKIG